MAFNVGKYVKGTAKAIGNRVLDDVVSSAASKLPQSTVSAARSTAESLFNIGASYESISAFATQKTDSLVNESAEVYYALAGKDPVRAAASDIKSRRRANLDRVDIILEESNPTTKIARRKSDASMILDAIV